MQEISGGNRSTEKENIFLSFFQQTKIFLFKYKNHSFIPETGR
jgi:hypothetical protein